MLHNTTREQLLQTGNGYVALVVDAAYFIGWREYRVFKANELIRCLAVLRIPARTVRIAIQHGSFQPQGRRNRNYMLPAASTLRKAIGASTQETARDELDESAFASLKSYRMALHNALIKRRRGRLLRALLATRLGVCKNTTRNYDKELGFQPTESFDHTPLDERGMLKLSVGAPYNWKYRLWIYGKDGWFEAPPDLRIATEWLKKKASVFLRQQMGNVYNQSAWASSYIEGELASFISH